jgi:WG containing repeat
VINHGKTGFIDKTGKIVIPLAYEGPAYFSEGYAYVMWGKSSGYIDTDGKLIWEGFGRPFSEGLAAVNTEAGTGFINTKGRLVIEPKYDSAGNFSDGLAAVYKNGKWGYIDKTGKIVVPMIFDIVFDF